MLSIRGTGSKPVITKTHSDLYTANDSVTCAVISVCMSNIRIAEKNEGVQ